MPGSGRSYYATPAELRFRPWSLDITPDDIGTPHFPHTQIRYPYSANGSLEWQPDDWDPALRFWSLGYDPQLTEWLRSANAAQPSIQAAREFGAQPARWQPRAAVGQGQWLEAADLSWQLNANAANPGDELIRANGAVVSEIVQLQTLMEDDRDRYLAEAEAQADDLAGYVIHFTGIDSRRRPWTVELISCALAIGNIAYMYWKGQFRRVRPSFLCPGLVPPFGPPQHPAFPSGHSMLGHLTALFLLEIPEIAARFGTFPAPGGPGTVPAAANVLAGSLPVDAPLFWLAQRLAVGRERIGVHYKSDSMAGRHLAAGLWWALLREPAPAPGAQDLRIPCPTLRTVLARAKSEWL